MPHVKEWPLEDASKLALDFKYTFWRPSDAVIAKLNPGNLVKLMYLVPNSSIGGADVERMWTRVTERAGDRFTGKLENKPHCITELELGDLIQFDSKHIIDTDLDDPVPDPTMQWRPLCLATSDVLKGEKLVSFFYREQPDNEHDSGWRFLSNGEDEDYCAITLGALLRSDDRMVSHLEEAAPVAYRWDDQSASFIPAEMPT